jgi:glycosyltransferase involved in cell wall biosynthesis
MAKIMLVVPYAKYYKNFSWDLIQSLALEGHQVIAAAPSNPYHKELASIGVEYAHIPIKNTGLNPFYDLYSIFKMVQAFKRHQPDILCCYSIKPVLYGSIAAACSNINQVLLMITGLGYTFNAQSGKPSALFSFVKTLYRFALDRCTKVLFENPDDLKLFHHLQLLKSDKALIVGGAGVNIEKFKLSARPLRPVVFLLIARLIKDKGIVEYVEAARLLKEKYPDAIFQLLGPFDSNPTAINRAEVTRWIEEGLITYAGETEDVRPYLKEASVFILPSYREGTPKSALEAMAMGLPVITTDAPGCRETVISGHNGFLVPVRDASALAEAMERFILSPAMILRMGVKSRELAVKKYDVRAVNAVIMEAMGLNAESKTGVNEMGAG